jgi:hypothetical protein
MGEINEFIEATARGGGARDVLDNFGIKLPLGVTVKRSRSGRWRVKGQGRARKYRTRRLAQHSVARRRWFGDALYPESERPLVDLSWEGVRCYG